MSSGRRSVRRDLPFIVITPDSQSTSPAKPPPPPPLVEQEAPSRKRGRDGNIKEKGVLQNHRKQLEDCYTDLARAYHDAYASRLDKEAAMLTSSPRKSAVFEDSIKEIGQRRDERKRIAKAQLEYGPHEVQQRYEGERMSAWESFYDKRSQLRQLMLKDKAKDLSALEREYRKVSLAAILAEDSNTNFLPVNTRSHTSGLGSEAIGDDLRSIRRASGRRQNSIHKALSSEEESLMEPSELDYMSSVVSSPTVETGDNSMVEAATALIEPRPPERQPLFRIPAQKPPTPTATRQKPAITPLATPRPSSRMPSYEVLPSLRNVTPDSSGSPRTRPVPVIRHLPPTLPILHGPVSESPAVEQRTNVPPLRDHNQPPFLSLPRKPFEMSSSGSYSPGVSPAIPFWHAPRTTSQSEPTRPIQRTSPGIPHRGASSAIGWLSGPKPSPVSWNPMSTSRPPRRVWDQTAAGAKKTASPLPWTERKESQVRADIAKSPDIQVDGTKDYNRMQHIPSASNHMGYTPRNPSIRLPANTSMYTIPYSYQDALGIAREGGSERSKEESVWLGYNPYVPNSAQASSAKYVNQSFEKEAQAIGRPYSRWRAVIPGKQIPTPSIPTPSPVLPIGRPTGY